VQRQDDPFGSTAVGVITPEAPVDAPAPPSVPKGHQRRRRLILVGAGALVVLLVAGAILAHLSLSQTYSAQRAVEDYFAAQARSDVTGMLSNATFLRGEGSYAAFYDKAMVTEMMRSTQNSEIREVKVTEMHDIGSGVKSVTVSMVRAGNTHIQNYTVRKDPGRVNWFLYPSWRIEIPSTTIHITLPNQAGPITVDGVDPPPGANPGEIQTISGFHVVNMASTSILDRSTQLVDATDPNATVTMPGNVGDAALVLARAAVTDAFKNCDAAKHSGCINHTYRAPNNNYIYFLRLPGYGEVDYTTYQFTLAGDPTSGMKLTVESETGKVSVSGSCAVTLTADGGRHYNLKGTYDGTLNWEAGDFSAHIVSDCAAQKA